MQIYLQKMFIVPGELLCYHDMESMRENPTIREETR